MILDAVLECSITLVRFFGKPHECMGLSLLFTVVRLSTIQAHGRTSAFWNEWVGGKMKGRKGEKREGGRNLLWERLPWGRYLFSQEHCLLYLKCLPSYFGYQGCQPQDSCYFWSLKCVKPIAGTKRRQPYQSCTAFLLLTSNIAFKVMQVFDCIELIIHQKVKIAEL